MRGPFSTPITPLPGSLFHADPHSWFICWYDDGGGRRSPRVCRKATGVIDREGDGSPPQSAIDALADHYAGWRSPVEAAPDEVLVENLLADWLLHVEKVNSDPIRSAHCVKQWLTFFDIERKAGRITRGPYVCDIKQKLCRRFIEWRQSHVGSRRLSHVSGATISRDLAALRAALRFAWKNEVIPAAPFVPEIEKSEKSAPKDLVYTPEQVARLLEVASATPERAHVHLFTMIMLSTIGRAEATLELDRDKKQIRDGLIYFLEPGKAQTGKRRSIVPIAPTLRPWLGEGTGKVIQYRTSKFDAETGEWQEIVKPTNSIRTAFAKCLIEAGICEPERDAQGDVIMLPPRSKLGETETRPKMRAIGSVNTLRHTASTEMHRRGVPEAQIDLAAGHAGVGTNKKNYRHLRPDYLAELIDGVEAFWADVGKHTDAHIHPSIPAGSARRTAC